MMESEPLSRLWTVERVSALFPRASRRGIQQHLGTVLAALEEFGLRDNTMVACALATIAAESQAFVPVLEGISKYNTVPGGAPYARYEKRRGNKFPGDGARYAGRGFIQLTLRENYAKVGEKIGLPLEAFPELANEPVVAARVLAQFLAARQEKLRPLLDARDYPAARRVVNGGVHGLDRFEGVAKAILEDGR